MTSTEVVRLTAEDRVAWVNASGLDVVLVKDKVDSVARQLARWIDGVQAAQNKLSIFDRTAYAAPDNPYQQMRVAKSAVTNDDVIAGVADVTEGLIFQGVSWESDDADVADVFNQINRDLDLDNFVRMWHREDFTYSQAIVGMWWGVKEYTVRGYNVEKLKLEHKVDPMTGEESFNPPLDPATNQPMKPKRTKRKKKFRIACPVALTFLDPARVVPLRPGPFGQDRLAWQATDDEIAAFYNPEPDHYDPVMEAFFLGKVNITDRSEKESLAKMGVDVNRLMLLNPQYVQRLCRTKASYERFPDLRLRSTFSLLDLKQQLMEADRVSLVGAANYILLVKKGDKDDPASQAEIDNLKEGMSVLAKLPVIVGDHRLNIEIITPDQSYTLDGEKYDTLDRRILNRALGSLTVTSSGQRNESTLTVARGVARLLETRRHTLKRFLEKLIARSVVDHPMNTGVNKIESEPNLTFTPRNVQLDNDSQIVQAVMALRTQKELSRQSTLEFFGFDQAVEAQRREYEEESGLDDIFGTTVPFDSPQNQGGTPKPAPSVSGAQGGRPTGGGRTANSPKKAVAGRTSSGNPRTGGK